MADTNKTLPVEVELAMQVMPCQAMRRTYDSNDETAHPCAHFSEWGVYHSYDYDDEGPPATPGVTHRSVYAGKRPLVPEILSGCRKAPILAVGINPNLPGWSSNTRNAIHPYFDDYLQYAHYFRWRAIDKLRIPLERYRELRGSRRDTPYKTEPLVDLEEAIDVELAPVRMYQGYQSLLDGLAEAMGWDDHKFEVGEDLAYANMVACGSARWTNRRRPGNDDMPLMGEERAQGIVQECFHSRKYFLRQMLQSLPAVVMVFSQTTANAFIAAMGNRFTMGDPQPQERLDDLVEREIRLRFGRAADGETLDARVVFSPHVSGRPDDFARKRDRVIAHLVEEANAGRLALNPDTGHLVRGRGGCQFCENALYRIGPCDYRAELRPLAEGDAVVPFADIVGADAATAAERSEHLRLLDEFTGAGTEALPVQPFDDAAPSAPKLVLRGRVVTMDGAVIDRGAVYLHQGFIRGVTEEGGPAPDGFEDAVAVETDGDIFPGLADLHNHLVYNILTLWWPRNATTNRSQWLSNVDYKRFVSMPMSVVAGRQDLIRAIIRYVEVKLILGGVTSGQGMISRFKTGRTFRGLVRNFERPDDPDLSSIGHRITDIGPGDIEKVGRALDKGNRYFFHLAEGTNDKARAQFTLLADNGLVKSNLVGIHSLGLQREDLENLAAADGKVVWSPFSNSVLYGETLTVRDLLDTGLSFGLGSDWTPSGSRNILEEMKIAWLAAKAEGVELSAEALAGAVSRDSVEIAGWGERLGRITEGRYADLVVVDRQHDDPYTNLLRATERNIQLVVIAGHARHGDIALMQAAGLAESQLEPLSVGGRDKALNLNHPSSPINHVSFAAAREALERALSDLPAARDATVFEPFDDANALEIELDMQALEPEWDDYAAFAEATLPESVPLDAPTVIDDPDYWRVLDSIPHLPAWLKGDSGLKSFYM